MGLRIYNTLSRRVEDFSPLVPGHIGLYVCGITVYDYCHLGHARLLVGFDTIARYLRARGWSLEYVRNVTDIDDKILRRANENGESFDALAIRFTAAMHDDEPVVRPSDPEHHLCLCAPAWGARRQGLGPAEQRHLTRLWQALSCISIEHTEGKWRCSMRHKRWRVRDALSGRRAA